MIINIIKPDGTIINRRISDIRMKEPGNLLTQYIAICDDGRDTIYFNESCHLCKLYNIIEVNEDSIWIEPKP